MSSCFHTLVHIKDPNYRYRCTKCEKRLKVASGVVTTRETPKVVLRLTSDEVIELVNLLELRRRTPNEEHILSACYRSRISK